MKTDSQSLVELEQTLCVNLIKPDTCWLDGETCPYGQPYGRFNDRPRSFCHTSEGGCGKLRSSGEVTIFTSPLIDKAVDRFEKKQKQEVEEETEPLHELLEHKANSLGEEGTINEVERGIILCASKVLKDLFPQVEVREIRE